MTNNSFFEFNSDQLFLTNMSYITSEIIYCNSGKLLYKKCNLTVSILLSLFSFVPNIINNKGEAICTMTMKAGFEHCFKWSVKSLDKMVWLRVIDASTVDINAKFVL